jgi:hypothetical protein
MATIIDTLITQLGFKTDTSGLQEGEQKFSFFKDNIFKIAGTIGAVLGGSFFVNEMANAADETNKFARSIGIAVEELGALEFATQRQGATVGGLRASLTSLAKVIGEAGKGEALGLYGIDVTKESGQVKNATELIIELNEKFTGLTQIQQFDLAGQMGISQDTIRLLQTAPNELQGLLGEARKYGVLTEEDGKKAEAFNDSLTNLQQVVNKLKWSFGPPIAALTIFFQVLADGLSFVRQNQQFFTILTLILGTLAAKFVFLKTQAALAWIAVAAPVIGVIAVLTLLAAAVDDVITFFKGGDSVLGDMIKKWPQLGKVVYFLRDAFVDFWNIAKNVFGWLDKVGMNIIDKITSGISTVIDTFGKVPDLFSGIGDFFTGNNENNNFGGGLGSAPIAASTFNYGAANRSSNIKVGDINISVPPGTDGKTMAMQVQDVLKQELANTAQNLDSGVIR